MQPQSQLQPQINVYMPNDGEIMIKYDDKDKSHTDEHWQRHHDEHQEKWWEINEWKSEPSVPLQ